MCKFCWGLSVVLIALSAGLGYMLMFKGSVTASDDGRTAILLSAGERDLVLGEMRGFLESVQTITAAIAQDDMKSITKAARKVGMANASEVPVSLMTKLPMEFKKLGMATHKAFDDLGMEAQDMGDAQTVLKKLGEMMVNCTTCHSSYRLEAENKGGK
jgi:cytochrome c556